MKKRLWSLVLALVLIMGLSDGAMATVSDSALDEATNKALQYLYETVPAPTYSSVGGEWAVLALARGEFNAPASYYAGYYQRIEAEVVSLSGVLDEDNYTAYSRAIVGLSAIGKDARNVGGYDLTLPLGDYDKTLSQGLNGPIWALIALDSAAYEMPVNSKAKTRATRQKYVDYLLSSQLEDGGWSLSTSSDPDMTAMALQALAKYIDQPEVSTAVSKGVERLSLMQSSNGGFNNSDGDGNTETVSQVVVALCELGISLNDSRFVKNGNTLLDNLLSFQSEDGGFKHTRNARRNDLMSSEQGSYALVAAQRAKNGKVSLYRMTDTTDLTIGGDLPRVTDIKGNVITAVVSSGGSTNYELVYGAIHVLFSGQGSEYIIQSTGNIPCVIFAKNSDGSYHPKAIETTGETHRITVFADEEIAIAVKGDISGDGAINASDLNRINAICLGRLNASAIMQAVGDVTGDGNINASDLNRVNASFLGNTKAIVW